MSPQADPSSESAVPKSTPDAGTEQLVIGLTALRERALALLTAARVRVNLLLLAPDLPVFSPPECAAALRGALRPPQPLTVRMLVAANLTRERAGAALWRLAQDWPSYVEVRSLSAEQRALAQPLLTVDDAAWLTRLPGEELRARVSLRDPVRVRALREQFDGLWWHAEADPECRRLGL